MNPALWHLLETAIAAKIQTGRGWRAPAGIERFDRSIFGRVEETERVAADTDRARLDDA